MSTSATLPQALKQLVAALERHRLLFLHFAEAARENPNAARGADAYERISKAEQRGYDHYINDIDSEGAFLLRNRQFLDDYADRALSRFGCADYTKANTNGVACPLWWMDEGCGSYLETSADEIRNAAAQVTAKDVGCSWTELVSAALAAAHDKGDARWYSGMPMLWNYLAILDEAIANTKRAVVVTGGTVPVDVNGSDPMNMTTLANDEFVELRNCISELLWSVNLIGTLRPSFFADHARAYTLLCQTMDEMAKCIKDHGGKGREDEREIVTLLNRALQSLVIVGYDGKHCPNLEYDVMFNSPPSGTPDVPSHVVEFLDQSLVAIEALVSQRKQRAEAAAKKEKDEVLKSQAAGCFLEYVRRNPGKGVLWSSGSIHIDEGYNMIDMIPEYTTVIEITRYPGERWVRWMEKHHCEAGKVDESVDEIDEIAAAREVLQSDVQLDVETIVWATRVCTENPAPTQTPEQSKVRVRWDRDSGKLYLDGNVVRTVRGSKVASNVVKILDGFQEMDWPERVDSPFHDDESGMERLRETIRSLNKGLELLQFTSDGNGTGIMVTIPARPSTSPASPGDYPF